MELINDASQKNTFVYGPRAEEHYPSLFLKFHHVVITMTLYFLVVKVFGPKIMSKRKPFSLTKIMMAYNLSQVLINYYLLHQAIYYWHSWIPRFWSHVCNPIGETLGFTEENKTVVSNI
nr:elongation of very long chain fatty acids protein AAEL008004 [Halyomorpha halys]